LKFTDLQQKSSVLTTTGSCEFSRIYRIL